MASASDVITRFVQACQEPKTRMLTARNCYFERSEPCTVYSYGRHFPLAEYHARGRRRPLMLVNGDRSTVTTSRHQSDVRAAIARAVQAGWNVDVILLPFSALDAAGIVHESIRPLEVRSDRTETIAHSAASLEDVPLYQRTRTVHHARETTSLEDVPQSQYRYGTVDQYGTEWSYAPNEYAYINRAGETVSGRDWNERYQATAERRLVPPYAIDGIYRWTEREYDVPLERGSDGLYHWETTRHHLGDSLFTGETVSRREITRPVSVSDIVSVAARTLEMNRDYGSTRTIAESWESLGNETITETVSVRTRRKYLSSFDENEPAPLYFLATMPRRSSARTVESALLDLAPRAVHAAYARNVPVYRQGDIFAIETTMSDAAIYGAARARTRLTVWDRGAAPKRGEIGYRAPPTKSQLARFENEVRDEYRRSRARYAITATERVRPTGKRTEPIYGNRVRYPRDHYRRFGLGDAIACYSLARSSVISRWSRMMTDRERARIRETLSLHGTAHTATEVCVLPGGSTYARGIMRHVPALEPNGSRWRNRDHVNVKLGGGDSWHLILRNTVPRAAR